MRHAVTLFSGLGSSSKALRDLGYKVIPHDFNANAVKTLLSNGFLEARQVDVRDIDYSTYPKVDIVAGGPPCQPFSQAGSQKGEYDPRDMIPEFIRAVRELNPEVFVMEEVKTLTWSKNRPYLDRVVADLTDLGYVVEWEVLDASDFRFSQARKRLFVVGVRRDIADSRSEPVAWPMKNPGMAESMGDFLGWTRETAIERNALAPEPAHDPEAAQWVFERPSTTVVGSFRPEVQAAPGYRKAGDGPRQNTPGSVVTTLEERLKLQDMPEDWIVRGSKAQRDLQVGNSVPCGLIRRIIAVNLAW